VRVGARGGRLALARRAPGRRGLAVALAVAGCTPAPFVGDPLAPRRGAAGTYSALAQQIFVPRCTSGSCHGGNPPPAFPQLDADAGWGAMVNVQSQEDVMLLVKPGAPDESWLMVRLRGEGGRQAMPSGDTQLGASELSAVEGWIANGAPND
jgi:mono/diheme cytochrome c family protein